MRAMPAVAWGAKTDRSPSPNGRQNRSASSVRSKTWLPRASRASSVLSIPAGADRNLARPDRLRHESGPRDGLRHAIALVGRRNHEASPQGRRRELPGPGQDELARLLEVVGRAERLDRVVDRALP